MKQELYDLQALMDIANSLTKNTSKYNRWYGYFLSIDRNKVERLIKSFKEVYKHGKKYNACYHITSEVVSNVNKFGRTVVLWEDTSNFHNVIQDLGFFIVKDNKVFVSENILFLENREQIIHMVENNITIDFYLITKKLNKLLC